jgi:hypothetical protein
MAPGGLGILNGQAPLELARTEAPNYLARLRGEVGSRGHARIPGEGHPARMSHASLAQPKEAPLPKRGEGAYSYIAKSGAERNASRVVLPPE